MEKELYELGKEILDRYNYGTDNIADFLNEYKFRPKLIKVLCKRGGYTFNHKDKYEPGDVVVDGEMSYVYFDGKKYVDEVKPEFYEN